jgi:hypothetical protein
VSAKGLGEVSIQRQVDYVNVTQRRVSGETFCLETRETFPLVAGTYQYQLPASVSYLLGIYNGADPLVSYTIDEIMPALSGTPENFIGAPGYALVGLTLYIVPTPSEDANLEILYYAYSDEFDSDDDLEITHGCVMAMEHLVEAYMLLDSGETEMGVNCVALAETDMARARRSMRGRGGHPSRMRIGRRGSIGTGFGGSVGQDAVTETYGSGEYGSGEYGY